jgi:hypothetical protein
MGRQPQVLNMALPMIAAARGGADEEVRRFQLAGRSIDRSPKCPWHDLLIL